jgi:hypothetical protein
MIKIAVATNKKFFEKSLPIIIPSLLKAGINPIDIHIFNAGYDEYSNEIREGIPHNFFGKEGITYHYLNHNSYEYSPLIEIVEREIESEYWFLIHDTCKVGPQFKKLLYEIPDSKPVKMALRRKPAMSIGLYKYEYLLTVKEKLIEIKNTDYSKQSMMKWKLWGVPNEDYILWMQPPSPIIYNNDSSVSIVDHNNWFNTDTIRRTEYYPSLDIYKNKSNWGQTGNNMVIDI